MPAIKFPDPNINAGQDDPAKIDRFKELARELGCDEDEAAFESTLKKMATNGPVPKHEPRKRIRKT